MHCLEAFCCHSTICLRACFLCICLFLLHVTETILKVAAAESEIITRLLLYLWKWKTGTLLTSGADETSAKYHQGQPSATLSHTYTTTSTHWMFPWTYTVATTAVSHLQLLGTWSGLSYTLDFKDLGWGETMYNINFYIDYMLKWYYFGHVVLGKIYYWHLFHFFKLDSMFYMYGLHYISIR